MGLGKNLTYVARPLAYDRSKSPTHQGHPPHRRSVVPLFMQEEEFRITVIRRQMI